MGRLEIAHLNTASNYQLKRSTDHYTPRRIPIFYLLHDKHLLLRAGSILSLENLLKVNFAKSLHQICRRKGERILPLNSHLWLWTDPEQLLGGVDTGRDIIDSTLG